MAQVIERWLIQRGIVVFSKTIHKERMVDNADVFDFVLSDDDMEAIKALDTEKEPVQGLRRSRDREGL